MVRIKGSNLLFACIVFSFLLLQNALAQEKLNKLIERRNYTKAEEYCNKQEGINQKICFKTLGDAYFDNKKYEEAAQCYEKSDNNDGFEKLGNIEYDKRNFEKALIYYEKAYAGNYEKMKECYIKIADYYFNRRDYEESIIYYEKAYDAKDDNLIQKYLEIGYYYYDRDKYDKAGRVYDKADYKLGLETIGDIYFRKDDIDTAIIYYNKAAELYEKANTGENLKELYYYDVWTDKTNGKVYKTVTIDAQVWMAENLRTSIFNDGTPINRAKDYKEWAIEQPACSWYRFDSTREQIYGKMYNWYAVNTGKLCPVGWHVPSKEEWEALETFLRKILMADGNAEVTDYKIGGMVKEAGTDHWKKPNTGAINRSGFTALPGGTIIPYSNFGAINWGDSKSRYEAGYYYTSTEGEKNTEKSFTLTFSYRSTQYWIRETSKKYGCSVRCIKD